MEGFGCARRFFAGVGIFFLAAKTFQRRQAGAASRDLAILLAKVRQKDTYPLPPD